MLTVVNKGRWKVCQSSLEAIITRGQRLSYVNVDRVETKLIHLRSPFCPGDRKDFEDESIYAGSDFVEQIWNLLCPRKSWSVQEAVLLLWRCKLHQVIDPTLPEPMVNYYFQITSRLSRIQNKWHTNNAMTVPHSEQFVKLVINHMGLIQYASQYI